MLSGGIRCRNARAKLQKVFASFFKKKFFLSSCNLTALARRLGALDASTPQRLSGGASQETWRFDPDRARRPHTPHPAARARWRCSPGGQPWRNRPRHRSAAHGSRLRRRRSRPQPCAPCSAPKTAWGEGFVMDFIEGETLGGRIVKSASLAACAQRPGLSLRRNPRAHPRHRSNALRSFADGHAGGVCWRIGAQPIAPARRAAPSSISLSPGCRRAVRRRRRARAWCTGIFASAT